MKNHEEIRFYAENNPLTGVRENILESEQFIPRPVSELFTFFSVETNLEEITPPFLNFRVLGKSTLEIEAGTIINYRLRLHGIPLLWRTLIEIWEPGKRFVDTQLEGPYKLWHHTHTFESVQGGTVVHDRVRFRLPLGWLGELVAGWKVKRDVRAIFEYRTQVIAKRFT